MSEPEKSLARIPLFRSLDATTLQRLADACTWLRAPAKSWVIDYRDEGTDLFFVIRGQVRVVIPIGGKETILNDIRDGEFFGEVAALDLQPRSAGILSVTDTLLARMTAAVFRETIHRHTDVTDQVLALLVSRVRILTGRASETAGLSMKQRLWSELLRLARPSTLEPGQAVVSPPPAHAEIAGRIGSHREAVTRELSALARNGLISKRRGAIVLTDVRRLRRMLDDAIEG